MKEVEDKYFAFSEGEFSILAWACGLTSILCFDPEKGRNEICKVDKRSYINILYQLSKRNILISKEHELILQPEIKELMSPLHESKFIIWYSCGYSERVDGFIYMHSDNTFLSAMPGKRSEEYIRLCLYKKDHALQFLKLRLLNEWDEPREQIELIVFDGLTHGELIRMQWNNEKPDQLTVEKKGIHKSIALNWKSIFGELQKILNDDKGERNDTC